MGSNFYLHRKRRSASPRAAEWTPTLHIGKSSHGWVFLWHGYRGDDAAQAGREIATPEEWWTFLNDELAAGAVIRSEEAEVWTPAELAQLIKRKAQPRPDGTPPRRHVNLSPLDTVEAGSSDVAFADFC